MIKFFSTKIGEEELAQIKRVAESGWYGYGEESKLFEKELGEKFGCENVLLTDSCTSALFLAMRTLNIKEGDDVIIPTIHHPSAVNAILAVGAIPRFADVQSRTLNINPYEVDRLLKKYPSTGAILLLHYGGLPCEMDEIKIISDRIGPYIIEDNANSPLSKYKGHWCGTLGHVSCWSFDSMKVLTSIDGGALMFTKEEYGEAPSYHLAKALRYYGFALKNQSGLDAMKEGVDRWWETDLVRHSGRYITNDILSAIGRVQFRNLESFVKRRKEIWDWYQAEFRRLDWITLPPEPVIGDRSSYYFYWLQLEDRDRFAKYLVDNDIYCTFKYQPLHLIPYYRRICYVESLPIAEHINECTINIPIHQYLTDAEVSHIIETVRKFK